MNAATLNAQRKRQRRQTAGALVTGLFGSNNNNNNNTTDAAAAAEGASPVAGKKGNRKKSTAQPRPEIQVPPRGIGPIYEPNVNDVLCGRGGRINAHEGNVRFRQMVVDHKKEYLAPTTKKLAKAHIAAQLVRDIRTKEPSGRFLKEDPDGAWFDIGDAKAIKKVGQALREDAPDIRQEIGSDEEEDGTKKPTGSPEKSPTANNNNHNKAEPQTLASIPIGTATAVSGRGAKVISSSSQRSVGGPKPGEPYAPLAYQTINAPPASYQPIIPPSNDQNHHQQGKTMFNGILGGRNTGVSGAAAAAIGADENPDFPAHDVAFGRQFHIADTVGDGSMISGMSGGTGAGGTQLSGMSGISALTDPMSSLSGAGPDGAPRHLGGFPQPAARPQTAQQFHAMRSAQLQQLRANWQHPTSQRTMNTLNSSDLRSIGGMSLQRSLSWQSGHDNPHMDTMSWADHSLMGGGIHGGASVFSGQQSFHSHYLRDTPMGGGVGGASVHQHHHGAPVNMGSGTSSAISGGSQLNLYNRPPPHQAPPGPAPAQLYHHGTSSSAGGGGGGSSSKAGSGERSGEPSGNASVASMSIASGSVSGSITGSIMSDLSENLVALDLAEPRLLDQFGSQEEGA
mmetsp:Transcript_1714/g.4687  ORF Transcript_1714/g.4687 Transcript_1714/m.4687 type:complete len:623 (-) Transcript_1714:108-1976(-)